MRWVLRYPSRFLQEQSDLDQLAKDVEWLVAHTWKIKPDLTIEVDIDLQIHGKPYALKLTYPPLFPDTPPYIGPRDQTELLSMHQYGPGGSLCLEWRADNWDRRITGADMVRSAHRLISLETHPEEPQIVPSMHQLTEGQILRGSEHRLIITPHPFNHVG
jgi:ubiquitin-protein ligase